MIGREQIYTIAQTVALIAQLGKLNRALFEQALVLTPCKHTAGTGDSKARHQEKRGKCRPLN